MKLFAFISAMLLWGSSPDYVQRLRDLKGTSYQDATCSGYITEAKRHAPCSAAEIWNGCRGDLVEIAEASSYSEVHIAALQNGDVLDFAGVHVGVILDGSLVDSTPERGVAIVGAINPHDLWYSGKVRILRWRHS